MNITHLDKKDSAFFNRELESIKSKSYDVKYKDLRATVLLPVETETPSGADTITWVSYGKMGVAKFIADYAADLPTVDVTGTEKSVPVRSLGVAYGYSVKEIRRSQLANKSLDQKRANAARRAIEQKIDTTAWFGSTKYDLNGFINYPGITEYTVTNGAGGSATWATKTPDEIIKDILGMVNSIVIPTNARELPDTLFLPLAQYNDISTRRVTDGDSKTVMQFILDTNPYIDSIEWVTELAGAGLGGTDRMMMLVRDVDHVGIQVPQVFEQFAAQDKSLAKEIPCHAETAGVIIYYPLSVSFGDGI